MPGGGAGPGPGSTFSGAGHFKSLVSACWQFGPALENRHWWRPVHKLREGPKAPNGALAKASQPTTGGGRAVPRAGARRKASSGDEGSPEWGGRIQRGAL